MVQSTSMFFKRLHKLHSQPTPPCSALLQCYIHGVQQSDCQVHLVPPHVSRIAIGKRVRLSSLSTTRLMAGPSPVNVRGRTDILLDEVNE